MPNNTQFADVINMSGLGDALRQAREKKNLTLDQAQKQTRINSTILKAIEEGRCDNVLNATYVKSFLKKYSEFLGLDPEQAVNNYKKLHPETEIVLVNKSQSSESSSLDMSRVVIALKIFITCLVAIVVVVFIVGKVATHFKKQGNVKNVVVSKSKKSPALIAASKRSTRLVQKNVDKKSTDKKSAEMVIPKSVPLKLLLKVNQPVMIKMRTDGNLLFERVLPKGTAEIFSAENSINIYAAKGEAVELILNGKSLGSPGNGILKNIEITRSGVKVK